MPGRFYNDKERVILIDKPLRWTSFDVVKKIKNVTGSKKVGHAGTLDPLATGLLIICTGRKTKSIQEFQDMEKEYYGVMEIGKTTPSIDLETPFDSSKDIGDISEEDVFKPLKNLTGTISQVPPIYSAIKMQGERVYNLARAGKQVSIKTREVQVKTFEITNISLPDISFKIECSKGTYIRSLVRDYGEILGPGAYLKSLRRTRIGSFKIEEADTIDSFVQKEKTTT